MKSIRVGCTIEPELAWVNAAALLYGSLRANGGPFRDSPFLLLVATDRNDRCKDYVAGSLTVRTCPRRAEIPYLQKVNQLFQPLDSAISHVLILDHDTVILSLHGLANFLASSVCARDTTKGSLASANSPDEGAPLARLAGRPWSEVEYFNSGVVLVPAEHREELATHWIDCATSLLPILRPALAEQVGLGVAIARAHLPWSVLPRRFNVIHWGELLSDASIIHYNDYDHENIAVKHEVLKSLESFRHFVQTTDNRFWVFFQARVLELLTTSLTSLAADVWKWVRANAC